MKFRLKVVNIQSLTKIVGNETDQENYPLVWPTRMTHEFGPRKWPTNLTNEFDPREWPASLTHEFDPRVWPTRMTHEFDPREWPTRLTWPMRISTLCLNIFWNIRRFIRKWKRKWKIVSLDNFNGKMWIGFCLNRGKRFIVEVSF